MTTIAYKDGILAADTLCTTGNNDREGTISKLARSPRGSIAGACGRADICVYFLGLVACGRVDDWLDDVRRNGVMHPLDLCLEPGEQFGALYVHHSGTVYAIQNRGLPYTYEAPFYADGSGHEYAKGAMSAGASAERAVRIAGLWDAGTSGDGDEMQILKLKG